MQVSANLGAGLPQFNEPYFNLYNDNLDNIAKWTKDHMGGRPGVCIPETMRFSGQGYENELWLKTQGISCSEDSSRTLMRALSQQVQRSHSGVATVSIY